MKFTVPTMGRRLLRNLRVAGRYDFDGYKDACYGRFGSYQKNSSERGDTSHHSSYRQCVWQWPWQGFWSRMWRLYGQADYGSRFAWDDRKIFWWVNIMPCGIFPIVRRHCLSNRRNLLSHWCSWTGNSREYKVICSLRTWQTGSCHKLPRGRMRIAAEEKESKPDGSHYREPAGYSGERAETRQPGLPTISVRGGRHIENWGFHNVEDLAVLSNDRRTAILLPRYVFFLFSSSFISADPLSSIMPYHNMLSYTASWRYAGTA